MSNITYDVAMGSAGGCVRVEEEAIIRFVSANRAVAY
jgi:hypothetical protein